MSEAMEEDDRIAAIVVAENTVLQAWEADDTTAPDGAWFGVSERDILVDMASKCLAQAASMGLQSQTSNPKLDRRATSVGRFVALAQAAARGEFSGRPAEIAQLLHGLVEYAGVAPPNRVVDFLEGVAMLCERAASSGDALAIKVEV